jgi:hypothetical protein
MGAAQSCELDQFAFVKIGQRFAHIGGKGRNVGIVLFGQGLYNLVKSSPVAARKNFVRRFVQFDDALREKQNAFSGCGVNL